MATNRPSNNTRNRPSEGGSSRQRPRGRFKASYWIYGAIFVALLALNFFFQSDSKGIRLSYSEFLSLVEQGHVAEVTVVNDTRVEGLFTEDAVEGDVVPSVSDNSPSFWRSDPDGRRAFVSTKPDDHELTDFLRAYNREAMAGELTPVKFSASVEEDWFSGIFSWILVFAILIALWIFLIRRMNPSQQFLNIGKNNAVLFDSLSEETIDFGDVAGLEEAKAEVSELVQFLQEPERFTRLGGKIPKGVLLVGSPGTGKTLLAKAVAGEAGVPFFSISGSDFVEMFVGVGAARVRDLFAQAKEKAPCIIFIDEIDAIGRSRGRNSMMGGNDERENTLNQLLVEMDGFNSDKGVIMMAATNRPDMLDPALLRPGRFDRQVVVDKPDRKEREAIFAVHTEELVVGDDVDLRILAGQTPGFAGAEIANVCNEAALLAAREGKDAVEMENFEQAIDRVIAGLEKKNKIISPEEKKIVAYHESGHAIAGWFLEHTDPILKISIIPRGLAALGYAQYLPEERYLYTREALMDQMTMALGGRIAEELVFGEISTGAQNDLERITKTAYAMVIDYGMSDRLGDLSYNLNGDDERPVFNKPYSDRTARVIDEEVKAIVDEVRQRARTLLKEHRGELEQLASRLLEKELLAAEEIEEILGERPVGRSVEGIVGGRSDDRESDTESSHNGAEPSHLAMDISPGQ